MDQRPLILTLRLDPELQSWFDALRQRHFPRERNFLSAHLTLFHALPCERVEEIGGIIAEAANRASFPVEVPTLRSLGRGVAFVIESDELMELRAGLARRWLTRLTPQDRQPFSPHVTIQNKVDPAMARALLIELSLKHESRSGCATGLDLWRYDGGPWEAEGGVSFRDVAP